MSAEFPSVNSASVSTFKTDIVGSQCSRALRSKNVTTNDKQNVVDLCGNSRQKKPKKAAKNRMIRIETFAVGEMVWAHLRGWPSWPCRVEEIIGTKVKVYWFNDYRTSVVPKISLTKFWVGIEQNKHKIASRSDIATAVQEVFIEMIQKGFNVDASVIRAVTNIAIH